MVFLFFNLFLTKRSEKKCVQRQLFKIKLLEKRRGHILKVTLNIFEDEGYYASSINRVDW